MATQRTAVHRGLASLPGPVRGLRMPATNGTIAERDRSDAGGYAKPSIDLRTVAILSVVVWAQALGGTVGTVTWIGLIGWSVTGAAAAVRAVVLGVLLLLLNPALFQGSPVATELRWVLLLGAGLCVAVKSVVVVARTRQLKLPAWCFALAAFYVLAVILTFSVSYAPMVSLLKLTAFLWGFATINAGIERSRNYPWLQWLCSLWATIVLTSIPLIASAYGYWRNGSGFQGITAQPQAYGILVAPITTYLTLWLFLNVGGRRGVLIVATCLGWLTMALSLSRTAVLSVILAGLLACSYALVARPDIRSRIKRQLLSSSRLAVVTIASALLALYLVQVANAVGEFLVKGKRAGGESAPSAITASLQDSRGGLIQQQLANIRQHPFTGIGFGVASDAETFHVTRSTSLFNLPSGASVEKGSLPTAVVEENGVFGALLFFLFIWLFIRRVLRRADAPAIGLVLCALLLNAGEMMFFSAGALGIFIWLTMGVAAAQTVSRRALGQRYRVATPAG